MTLNRATLSGQGLQKEPLCDQHGIYNFMPIVSLLEGVSGIRHLACSIELYLECKDSNFCYYAISPLLYSSKSSAFHRNMN